MAGAGVNHRKEPIATWRMYAQRAAALVLVASQLAGGPTCGSGRWRKIGANYDGYHRAEEIAGSPAGDSRSA
jgi:hypothetical protein